jgi:putative tryptophan/tyrosine transport system substrate-binding protein
MMPDTFNIVHRERTIALAARYKLPAVYPYRFAVREGGLLSYGVDQVDLFRRAGGYVGRILKGDKPAELPVQTPTKFEIAINLGTAKALGVEVPQTLLVAADEVVE